MWEIYSRGQNPYDKLTNAKVQEFVTSGGILQVPENCPKEYAPLMESCWSFKSEARPSFSELLKLIDVKAQKPEMIASSTLVSNQLRAEYAPAE
jgi:hypothetical protein